MKRLFNLRMVFLIALSLAAGIYIGFCRERTEWFFIAAVSLAGAVFSVFLCLALIFRTKKKGLAGKSAVAVICCVFTVFGFFSYSFEVAKYSEGLDVTAVLSGTVTDKIERGEGLTVFYMRDARAVNSEGEIKLTGYVRVTAEGLYDIKAGDTITVSARIVSAAVENEDGITTYFYKNNIRFATTGSAEILSTERGKPNIWEYIRVRIKDNLYSAAGKENGAVLYALLLGDRTDMEPAVLNAFTESGLVHMFAVSGLHVGFLSLVILWLLKKCKAGRLTSFFVQLGFFAFYAALCSFSPSVMRAALTALILQLSAVTFRRYDMLTAASASAALILLFRPLYLFDAGFLMTYASVFGINCLAKPLGKLFSKLPKFIASPLAMSLAVQIVLIPIMAAFFGRVPLLGIFLNVIAIPVISVTFISLFAAAFISVLLPFMSFLLFIPSVIITPVKTLSFWASSSDAASFALGSVGLLAVILYSAVYIGRYMTAERRVKAVFTVGLTLIFTLAAIIVNIPAVNGNNVLKHGDVFVFQNKTASAVIAVTGETTLIIGKQDAKTLAALKNFKKKYAVTRFDRAVLTEVTDASVSALEDAAQEFTFGSVVAPKASDALSGARYLRIETVCRTPEYIDTARLWEIDFADATLEYFAPYGVFLKVSSGGNAVIFVMNETAESAYSNLFAFIPYTPNIAIVPADVKGLARFMPDTLVASGGVLYDPRRASVRVNEVRTEYKLRVTKSGISGGTL